VWEDMRGRILIKPDTVPMDAHWRVCGLKYRFRNYGELFRCLDLIEASCALTPI